MKYIFNHVNDLPTQGAWDNVNIYFASWAHQHRFNLGIPGFASVNPLINTIRAIHELIRTYAYRYNKLTKEQCLLFDYLFVVAFLFSIRTDPMRYSRSMYVNNEGRKLTKYYLEVINNALHI